jgi:hypothetical protein
MNSVVQPSLLENRTRLARDKRLPKHVRHAASEIEMFEETELCPLSCAVTNVRFAPLHGLPVALSPSRPRPFHFATRALVTSVSRMCRIRGGLPSAARRRTLRSDSASLCASLRSSLHFPARRPQTEAKKRSTQGTALSTCSNTVSVASMDAEGDAQHSTSCGKPLTAERHRMKTSRFNPATQQGSQPVRVLQHNLTHGLENANPGFLTELKRLIAEEGLQPGISYRISDCPIVGPKGSGSPSVRSSDKKIELPETFLSFMWGVAYTLVVVFSEMILKPAQIGRTVKPDARSLEGADKLLKYATSLITDYSRWAIHALPNPEFYDPQDDPYVEKTNGAFVPAVVFVLCHEAAHVALGHCTLDNLGVYVPSMDSKLDETAADFYAIDTMRKNPTDGRFQWPEATGIIAGLTSLLMLSKEVREDRHPDTDERLIAAVRRLDLPGESLLWGLGAAAIKLWDNHYNRGLVWPEESDSYKALFDHMADKMTKRVDR